jgi:hypothetical protein
VEAVIGLILIVAMFGLGAMFGYAILEPVIKADRSSQSQLRFCTCDFFALSFLLTIPILFFTSIRRLFVGNEIIVDVIGFILIGVFACACVREATSLSGIGVVDAPKRFTYLALLLPIAIVGSAVIVPMLIVLTFSLPDMTRLNIYLWLGSLVVVPTVAILCRKCTQWVLSPAGTPTGTPTELPAPNAVVQDDQERQHTA